MRYTDDPDQLPELPDPGPRDGRHGVDRDLEFDQYPPASQGVGTLRRIMTVSLEDAKKYLPVLVKRVESGGEIVLTRNGSPVARIIAIAPKDAATPRG